MNRVAIIFPAFNEVRVIGQTIKAVRAELQKDLSNDYTLIVIDDGSNDKTFDVAKSVADVVLHHRHNRGLGAALATGIEYVKRKKCFDFCVTFDSDGQHNPKDIVKAVEVLRKGNDVVIGSRFLHAKQNFPKLRKTILQFSNIVTYLFFGISTTDSQSGFRAFKANAINKLELRTNRMEVSSEFFAEIKRNQLLCAEIPIIVKYTAYSLKKGQSNLESIKVLVKLFYRVFH